MSLIREASFCSRWPLTRDQQAVNVAENTNVYEARPLMRYLWPICSPKSSGTIMEERVKSLQASEVVDINRKTVSMVTGHMNSK